MPGGKDKQGRTPGTASVGLALNNGKTDRKQIKILEEKIQNYEQYRLAKDKECKELEKERDEWKKKYKDEKKSRQDLEKKYEDEKQRRLDKDKEYEALEKTCKKLRKKLKNSCFIC